MKILIIHASAGQGHKRAAEAIFNIIRQETCHNVAIIDSFDFTNSLFKFLYKKGYAFLVTHFPSVWGFFYRHTDKPRHTFLNSFFSFFNNNLNSPKLRTFLMKEKPDVIISTHFFANEVISELKKKNLVEAELICIITDFLVHHYWLSDGVDKYLVACWKTKEQLLSLGVVEEKIRITGIPIDSKFFLETDRNDICQRLNLNPNKFSALVATGTFGFKIIEQVVNLLRDEVQLLIVCGNNKRLFQKLSSINHENLKVFGLITNMHELMSVVDVIVTKPGGLTISEALVKNLPMIFISPIPGQETNNAKFFQDNGLAVNAKNLFQIKEIITQFKNNKDSLEQFKLRLAKFPKANSAEELLKLI
ncbi:MAG: glycosyltransferase [Candidatus Omnitrophota bacterium]|nr:glycosyltransferase [Candidatus Omnitrophota bacterium]